MKTIRNIANSPLSMALVVAIIMTPCWFAYVARHAFVWALDKEAMAFLVYLVFAPWPPVKIIAFGNFAILGALIAFFIRSTSRPRRVSAVLTSATLLTVCLISSAFLTVLIGNDDTHAAMASDTTARRFEHMAQTSDNTPGVLFPMIDNAHCPLSVLQYLTKHSEARVRLHAERAIQRRKNQRLYPPSSSPAASSKR